MNVVCSFHVGSCCYDAEAYTSAITSARQVFDFADPAGYHFNLLDIGGGFPGLASAKPSFDEVKSAKHQVINAFRSAKLFAHHAFMIQFTDLHNVAIIFIAIGYLFYAAMNRSHACVVAITHKPDLL